MFGQSRQSNDDVSDDEHNLSNDLSSDDVSYDEHNFGNDLSSDDLGIKPCRQCT